MRCYGDVDATPTITSLQGVTLPPLLCLRSRVSLQHPDESCETHYISGRKGRCCTTCRPTEGHAGGAAAGVQAVPVHPEASTHWNTERICRWDYFSLKGIKNRRLSVDADAFWVVSSDFSQKPFKRRRSLITWAFWRGSSSHLNELSLGEPHGCLFGQPLSAVCLEDALPKPVMVSQYSDIK